MIERHRRGPDLSAEPAGSASKARLIAWASGIVGFATALMVLAGWAFDVPILRRIIPGQPPMVILTAVGALLLATSILSGTFFGAFRLLRRSRRWTAASAAAIGIGGLLQYVLPLPVRLDDWVQRLVFGPLKPGSGMALSTAASIVAVATGLLLKEASRRRLRDLGTLVSLVGFVIAAVGALGHLYGLGALHQEGPFSRMALVTAVALSILAVGALASRPPSPWIAPVLGTGEPRIGAHGKPVLFLHPKDFLGTLVELEQV